MLQLLTGTAPSDLGPTTIVPPRPATGHLHLLRRRLASFSNAATRRVLRLWASGQIEILSKLIIAGSYQPAEALLSDATRNSQHGRGVTAGRPIAASSCCSDTLSMIVVDNASTLVSSFLLGNTS